MVKLKLSFCQIGLNNRFVPSISTLIPLLIPQFQNSALSTLGATGFPYSVFNWCTEVAKHAVCVRDKLTVAYRTLSRASGEREREQRDIASADAVLSILYGGLLSVAKQNNSGDSHTLPVSIVTVPTLERT